MGFLLTEQEETRDYPELWADMVRYNETIYTQGQAGLSCEYDYQKPSRNPLKNPPPLQQSR